MLTCYLVALSCRFSGEVWKGISHTDGSFLSPRLGHSGIRCSLFALSALVLRKKEEEHFLKEQVALGAGDAVCVLHIGTGNKLGV